MELIIALAIFVGMQICWLFLPTEAPVEPAAAPVVRSESEGSSSLKGQPA